MFQNTYYLSISNKKNWKLFVLTLNLSIFTTCAWGDGRKVSLNQVLQANGCYFDHAIATVSSLLIVFNV